MEAMPRRSWYSRQLETWAWAEKVQSGLIASLILSAAVVLLLDVLSHAFHFEDSFFLWIVAAVMFFAASLFIASRYRTTPAVHLGRMGAGIAIGGFIDAVVAKEFFGASRNLWPIGIVLFWVIGLIPIWIGLVLGRQIRSRRE